MIEAAIATGLVAVALGVVGFLALRGWACTLTFTAKTKEGLVSLGGGLEVAWLSASAAAILGGPGVLVVQFRSRKLYELRVARVTLDALLAWVDELLSAPPKEKGFFARIAIRVRDWLLPRTDLDALPETGGRIVLGLKDPSMEGTVTIGFADPALTGKTAAVLFPIAGMLAPLGTLDVRLDWSGRTLIDADVEARFRFVLIRIARETAVFAWRHVHPRRKLQKPDVSHTLPEPRHG